MVVSQYFGVGERTREGNDLYYEMRDSGVIKKTNGIWSNERATWCTYACGTFCIDNGEYFRDEQGQDVLLFIDNIFRFTQAGSEVSHYWDVCLGYQPTLATEMGQLQERITSTNKGSVTSIQAVFVPTDDYTDPPKLHSLT